jgi:hypothetical protein
MSYAYAVREFERTGHPASSKTSKKIIIFSVKFIQIDDLHLFDKKNIKVSEQGIKKPRIVEKKYIINLSIYILI